MKRSAGHGRPNRGLPTACRERHLAALATLAVLLGGCSATAPPNRPDLIAVDGHPFSAVALDDGTMLVSVSRGRDDGAIIMLHPAPNGFVAAGSFPVDGRAAGLAVSHDGRLVAVAADHMTLLLDRTRLLSQQGDPIVSRVGQQTGAIYVAFSPDDRLLAISEEGAGRVMLLPLGSPGAAPTELDVGRAPVGLAFSPDGRWLYATSENGRGGGGGCPASSGRASVAPGTVATIALGSDAPPHVTRLTRIGCAPVRIILSPDGALAFVSLRGDDRVAAFQTDALRAGEALPVATIESGPAPVGLALSTDGHSLRVANSNRFDQDAPGSISCVAVATDGRLTSVGAVATGAFPREVSRLPDGRMVATIFGSDLLQLLPAHC